MAGPVSNPAAVGLLSSARDYKKSTYC